MKEKQVYCWEVASAVTQKTKLKNCICCGSKMGDSRLKTENCMLQGFEVSGKRSKKSDFSAYPYSEWETENQTYCKGEDYMRYMYWAKHWV